MGRPRIVDKKDARRRYRLGWRVSDIALLYGVSDQSIRMALDDTVYARKLADSKRRIEEQRRPCENCGQVRVWAHYGSDNPKRSPDGRALCVRCRGLEKATTVRPDTLQCNHCHEWKPDDEFPAGGKKIARRGRHSTCRACQNAVKHEWRWRNAKKCRRCGGPRGADTDQISERRGLRPTGLCRNCWIASVRVT